MLVVISPAKTLDFESSPRTQLATMPVFLDDSELLISALKEYSPAELASFMHLSDKLAALNSTRYENWSRPFSPKNAKQAILAFQGDVYTGLDAENLSKEEDDFAQAHLRILSGLYGVIRPFDLIQPYRLEMGTKLSTQRGKDLYAFWGNKLTDSLNADLEASKTDTLINLASNEYFKSIKTKQLNARIITPVFKDEKNGKYKVISFYAKKARGMMVRFIVQNSIEAPEQIKKFNMGGYSFNKAMSSEKDWVFTRPEQG
jgi:hypothetical protein